MLLLLLCCCNLTYKKPDMLCGKLVRNGKGAVVWRRPPATAFYILYDYYSTTSTTTADPFIYFDVLYIYYT